MILLWKWRGQNLFNLRAVLCLAALASVIVAFCSYFNSDSTVA